METTAAGRSAAEWLAAVDEHRAIYRTSLATDEILRSTREDRDDEGER